ncbi:MAG: DUF3575 domain-containing protein [Bacteroidetes bacterium]|nr:MAG: DUF3575 domain-containing protein [Bacteroidota bacterium]
MKKILTLTLLVLFMVPTQSQAQSTPTEEKNVIKVNTLSLIIGTGQVFYERKFTDAGSGQLGISYMSYKFGDVGFSGLVFTPEYRWYFQRNALDGVYTAPYAKFANYSLSQNSASADYTNYGGGVVIGRQWIRNSGFTLDLYFGGHYGSGKLSASNESEDWESDRFEGFRPRIGFLLGFAF